ncbi:MAG: FxDxF family PEP-CTERM protein [Thiobacillus sp.]|nr:FxDxF family PEP-CTERM protein [Thiobacillus sp.]
MKLHALALATGLMMAGGANASVSLALTDTDYLGAFGAPTTWGETFSVTSTGTINHSLTFDITTPLYAGSGVSDIPLSFFSIDFTNITGLSAAIYDSSNALYTTFVQNGDPDHLILPDSSFFAIGNYTLKVGGNSVGTNGAFYSVAAVTVPVPEPETWAMLLAGLGLVGLRLRQKA